MEVTNFSEMTPICLPEDFLSPTKAWKGMDENRVEPEETDRPIAGTIGVQTDVARQCPLQPPDRENTSS